MNPGCNLSPMHQSSQNDYNKYTTVINVRGCSVATATSVHFHHFPSSTGQVLWPAACNFTCRRRAFHWLDFLVLSFVDCSCFFSMTAHRLPEFRSGTLAPWTTRLPGGELSNHHPKWHLHHHRLHQTPCYTVDRRCEMISYTKPAVPPGGSLQPGSFHWSCRFQAAKATVQVRVQYYSRPPHSYSIASWTVPLSNHLSHCAPAAGS